MKKVEFRPGDLSDRAFTQYSTCDYKFFVDTNGTYYVGETAGTSSKVGLLKDVDDFLISLEC